MSLVKLKGRREIDDGLHFVKECIQTPPLQGSPDDETLEGWYEEGRELHLSQNAYLFLDDQTLLFDTLTPGVEDDIVDQIDALLDGRPLDFLVISHPEANHAGNTVTILEAHPEATLVAPARGSDHHIFGLDESTRYVEDGDSIDLGQYTVEFVAPVIYDHAMTIWMRELETSTLFTVDFLGFEHLDGECLDFAEEMEGPVTAGRLERFHSMAFTWLRYVDTDRIDEAIDRIIDDLDPDRIAMAHGQIVHDDPESYLERVREAIHSVSDIDQDSYHIHTNKMRREPS